MVVPVPKRLKQDTIIQALFELRFSTQDDGSAAELFPGLIKPFLGERFPTIQTLPLAELPKALREQNAGFKYSPLHMFAGTNESVALGSRIISYTVSRPYPGWDNFRRGISVVINAIRQTGLLSAIERYSIKYINIIPDGVSKGGLANLKFSVSLADVRFLERGFRLRLEHDRDNHTCVITIVPDAQAAGANIEGALKGLLLDIDVVKEKPGDLELVQQMIETTHTIEKETYFRIVTDDVIDKLGPEW